MAHNKHSQRAWDLTLAVMDFLDVDSAETGLTALLDKALLDAQSEALVSAATGDADPWVEVDYDVWSAAMRDGGAETRTDYSVDTTPRVRYVRRSFRDAHRDADLMAQLLDLFGQRADEAVEVIRVVREHDAKAGA